ncbi:relaxase/mobilization nuclease domain-containing protein [Mesorhizobium australicum]|uniref:Relaxase/Mobilisation nuclease domain-containing protein n=1 Tax=Mesorhizobium australicum TaxID=536018 RepID=A0A1X7N0H1_9HYPH|nr:relaxase/mobilization nuclease domain-containing protein [Mesorhizobium australicum]SMH30287.1 Relaxase/Mobilisation nuclease domain-containing protein [Mesorhizobium australicum]
MILKGSQRAGGQNLAVHLLRTDDNEHISLHELRGFAGDNLKAAFKEVEAIARGTNCRQYLFSLSLSPPEGERVPVPVFEDAVARIEKQLGLDGQPRALVFHEKEGRRHAHAVWSRIDADTMTARPLPFFKNRLRDIARDLYLEHGWKMPRGFANAAERNPTNFTLAEWQQAKRQDIDPRWLKQTVQECWRGSDGLPALRNALEERGFFLAKGDQRGFVVLDHRGDVWSLPRLLDVKTKEVRARLGDGEALPSVTDTRKTIGQRMTLSIRRHVEESRAAFKGRAEKLASYRAEMTQHHRKARTDLDARQKSEWDEETRARAGRLPKGLRGLWHRLTGKYQQIRRGNELEARRSRERQAAERQALIERQLEQRAVLQARIKEMRREQATLLRDLHRDIGRYLAFSRQADGPGQSLGASTGLKLQR